MSGGKVVACPFCGHEPQDLRDAFHPSGIRWREDHGQRHYIGAKDPRDGTQCWELSCLEHEGGCGASMSGDSREEVLAKWNRRALATDLAAPKGGVVDDARVERVARALAEADDEDPSVWRGYTHSARAALTAALATGEQP